MVILINGTSHTGKTRLASDLIKKYHYPSMSIDHLKMGLIRSHNTNLNPESSDEDLTDYLWPIVSEMIKTAIENNQNLIVEGVYIPMNYKDYFNESYLKDITFVSIIMSETYLRDNFLSVKKFGSVIENRLDDSNLDLRELIKDNKVNLELANKHDVNIIYVDKEYDVLKQWEEKYDL